MIQQVLAQTNKRANGVVGERCCIVNRIETGMCDIDFARYFPASFPPNRRCEHVMVEGRSRENMWLMAVTVRREVKDGTEDCWS
jgi:NADH:ubiquinone oxidoreductase subunit B-like Fe-S oxidoreductase